MTVLPMGWGLGHWGALLPRFTDEETGIREGRDVSPFKIQMKKWVQGEGSVPTHLGLSPESPPPSCIQLPPQPILPHGLRVRPSGGRGHSQPWGGGAHCGRRTGVAKSMTPLHLKSGRQGSNSHHPLCSRQRGALCQARSQNFSDLIKISLSYSNAIDSRLDQWRKYDHHYGKRQYYGVTRLSLHRAAHVQKPLPDPSRKDSSATLC